VEGADIGLLGIELHSRRRNRLNGTVLDPNPRGFTVRVGQSFGNCPQYIQARQFEMRPAAIPKARYDFTALGAADREIIAQSDTFFIATAARGTDSARGVDVSHRGGKPGFVRVEDEQTLLIPDFAGNLHFNTVGNLLLNPRAGLLFIDFEQGDLRYLTGHIEVIWEGAELRAFTGAERLLRFQLTAGRRVEGSLPLRWSAPDFSPFLERTGAWGGFSDQLERPKVG
jgi:predicted pyridoxine 5'-phosphate oxidase superfamily flavin-nucleotide-binding protein